jgi:hypothetical protein
MIVLRRHQRWRKATAIDGLRERVDRRHDPITPL